MRNFIFVLLGLMLTISAGCTTPGGRAERRGRLIPANKTEQWLHKVEIAEIDFSNLNLFDCVSFVQRHLDQYAAGHRTKAPRFVYDIEAERYLTAHAAEKPFAKLPTFKGQKLTALEVMKLLEAIGRLHFVTKPELIVVEKK